MGLAAFPLAAQTVGTLDVGVSQVRYDGFVTSATLAVAPAVRHDTPTLSVGAQGLWALFESGRDILQGSAAAAWLTPASGRLRAELSGSFGVTRYADAPSFGHLLARTRVHYLGSRAGAWLGAATGGAFGGSGQVPLEIALGAWTAGDRVALAGTVTRSAVGGGGYTDVVGAARWTNDVVTVDGLLGSKPSGGLAEDLDDAVYGAATVTVAATDVLSLAASAGRSPSDPVRGLLASEYASVGIRMRLFGARAPEVPTVTRAIARSAADLAASPDASRARLEVVTGTLATTLRVAVAGASSVEIMGDFTDWQPVSLTRQAPGMWLVQLAIPSGVHRVNIRVDGGPWRVPLGTRLEETEFGGAAGVIVVP